MAALVCDICGGKLISKAGGIFECEYCGMQYDKTRIQEMVQEIKGTVKVEGTVEVTGTVKLDGPVKVESSISIDNLLKRGFMQLEDGRWDTATETFNQILAMDPENGRAYLGLAMATQHVYSIYEIEKIVSGHGSGRNILIKHDKNFKRAEKYADGELKARFAHWNELREKYLATLEVERLARKKVDVKARAKLEPLRKKSATVAGLIAARINTVGLSSDGRVVATGYNEDGQCDVSDWEDIVAISTGYFHTVGLRSDGTTVATGNDEYCRCDVSNWTDIVAISAGYYHTVGLRSDGTVVAVGWNRDGECLVSDWKLFDNYENLDQEREEERIVWEKRFEEERRRNTGLCQHCGGELKGFFTKKCVACGKPKDY